MPYKDPNKRKEYLARHYQENKTKYDANSRAARVRRFEKLAELKNNPCTDCGSKYPPYVMEFDHVK